MHENWMRLTDGIVDLPENTGWLTSGFVPHALTGSSEKEPAEQFRYHVIVCVAGLQAAGEGADPVFDTHDEAHDEARDVVA